jgi:S1-C subfamily serine protease
VKPPGAYWESFKTVFIIGGAAIAVGAAYIPRDDRPSADVMIKTIVKGKPDGSSCSGVYLGNGVVLTAKHCITKGAVYGVILDDDGLRGGSVMAVWEWSSDKDDLATLHVAEKLYAERATLACRPPQIGEPIEVVGNPLDTEFIHTWGRVAGVKRSAKDDNDEVPVDAMIASGNSGGPAYDSAGRVLGIVNEALDASGTESVGHLDFMVSSEGACSKYANKHAVPEFLDKLSHAFKEAFR